MNRDLGDSGHLRQFEDQSLPPEFWHHRAHLKVAYLYPTTFTFEEALEKLRSPEAKATFIPPDLAPLPLPLDSNS